MAKRALLLSAFFFVAHVSGTNAQTLTRVVFDSSDVNNGYYLAVVPQSDSITGVLVLLAGFGQRPEDTPPETKLHNVAYSNGVLTIFYAAGNKLYADSVVRAQLSRVLRDVISRYSVNPSTFVLGGFSAGGMVALRYTELCYEQPNKYPIRPKGVFTVDSPIDVFTVFDLLEENLRNAYSELAVEEAQRAIQLVVADHGVPRDNVAVYSDLTAFSMNTQYGRNERFLEKVAVRTYHDVDIAWRIEHRNQGVHNSNYEVTAELINRLRLMGNTRAEFMQTFRTGFRANGLRHPHSWSIVDEVDLLRWMRTLLTP